MQLEIVPKLLPDLIEKTPHLYVGNKCKYCMVQGTVVRIILAKLRVLVIESLLKFMLLEKWICWKHICEVRWGEAMLV